MAVAECVPSCARVERVAREGAGRGVSIRDRVASFWKTTARHWPPAKKHRWLSTPEAICALGARQCAKFRRQLEQQKAECERRLASVDAIDAWWKRGQMPPGLEFVNFEDACFLRLDGREDRPHAVRLRLSRAEISIGQGPGFQRYTPPQALAVEDALDSMTRLEAERYQFPASPSAVVIFQIGELRGVEA